MVFLFQRERRSKDEVTLDIPFCNWRRRVNKVVMVKTDAYPLKLIIGGTPHIFMSVSNDAHHELSSLAIVQM